MASYPKFPDNRLIVNGVDLSIYGMVLADGYKMPPPTPKTYTVDIVGGNGIIDLTESLSGDVVYNPREQEFTFYVIYPRDFELTMRDIKTFLHGKEYNYEMTMDKGYMYHGRFEITDYSHQMYSDGIVGTINVKVIADPYKYQSVKLFSLDGLGGATYYLESGRMKVRPTIQNNNQRPTVVIFKGHKVELPTGSWTATNVVFSQGYNEIYIRTKPVMLLTWGELVSTGTTWGYFQGTPLYKWYNKSDEVHEEINENGEINEVHTLESQVMTWEEVLEKYTYWSNLEDLTWNDLCNSEYIDPGGGEPTPWDEPTEPEYDDSNLGPVYIKYSWGDL